MSTTTAYAVHQLDADTVAIQSLQTGNRGEYKRERLEHIAHVGIARFSSELVEAAQRGLEVLR